MPSNRYAVKLRPVRDMVIHQIPATNIVRNCKKAKSEAVTQNGNMFSGSSTAAGRSIARTATDVFGNLRQCGIAGFRNKSDRPAG